MARLSLSAGHAAENGLVLLQEVTDRDETRKKWNCSEFWAIGCINQFNQRCRLSVRKTFTDAALLNLKIVRRRTTRLINLTLNSILYLLKGTLRWSDKIWYVVEQVILITKLCIIIQSGYCFIGKKGQKFVLVIKMTCSTTYQILSDHRRVPLRKFAQ